MPSIRFSFHCNLLQSGKFILTALLAVLALIHMPLSAQPSPNIAGNYIGTLGPLHVKLHINVDAAGAITGILDSVDQGAIGIPCADFRLDGQSLAFAVPAVHGTWKGTLTADGLTGTWDQGAPQPLNFTRDTFVPASKPSPIDGVWLGSLSAGGHSLRIQISVRSDASSHEFCPSTRSIRAPWAWSAPRSPSSRPLSLLKSPSSTAVMQADSPTTARHSPVPGVREAPCR